MIEIACGSREEWLERRKRGIGSSDAAAIMGLSPWRTPLQVYCDKVGIKEALDGKDEESEAMLWGRTLEPVIAKHYQEETGRAIVNPGDYTIQIHDDIPYLICTVDRMIPAEGDRPRGILEIKLVGARMADQWEEGAPPYYAAQIQHQMAVTGLTWGSFGVLVAGTKFLWCDVQRDEEFIGLLKERAAEFWRGVEDGDPPSPLPTETDKRALFALYPKHEDGASINLPAEAVDWDAERSQAAEEIKAAEARKLHAENMIRAAIGDNAYGILPNGVRYSWLTSERAAYEVKATTIRTLRRLKA
jgi:putative phage-type endonuclease